MARKARNSDEHSNANEVKWGGFIDIRLTEDQKAAFYVWQRENEPGMWEEFAEVVAKGFKFGLSYDAENGCYIATFTASGRAVIGLDQRYCLTARAPEWPTALSLLLYKHVEIARGDWGTYSPVTQRMANFG